MVAQVLHKSAAMNDSCRAALVGTVRDAGLRVQQLHTDLERLAELLTEGGSDAKDGIAVASRSLQRTLIAVVRVVDRIERDVQLQAAEEADSIHVVEV